MRRRRFALGIALVGSTAALVLALVLLAPGLAARRAAARLGAGVQVRWLAWNPLTATWTLTGLRIAAAEGAPAAVVRRATATLALRDVIQRRWNLTTLVLEGARLRLQPTDTGWTLPPLPSVGGDATAPALPSLDIAWAAAPRAVVRLEPGRRLRSNLRLRYLEGQFHVKDGATRALVWTRGRLDRGSIAFVARLHERPGGRRLRARLLAERLDLARVLHLTPGTPVRDLRGWIDLQGKYGETTAGGQTDRLAEGRLLGEHLALGSPRLKGLWIRRFRAPHVALDLTRRQVSVNRLELEEPEVWFQPSRSVGSGGTPSEPSARRAPEWSATVERVGIRGGRLHYLGDGWTDALDAKVREAELGPVRAPAVPTPFRTELDLADGGQMTVRGMIDWSPVETRADVELREVALPSIVAAAGPGVRLESGLADGRLELRAAGEVTEGAGWLTLRDVRTRSPDPDRPEQVLAFETLRLGVRRARVEPLIEIELDAIELEGPYLLLDRTPGGLFPFTLLAGRRDGFPGEGPMLHVRRLAAHHGRVDFRDAVRDPSDWRSLSAIELRADDVEAAPLRIAALHASGLVDELAPLRVQGNVGEQTHLVAEVERLGLPPFNPYLTMLIPYSVSSGSLGARTEITVDRGALQASSRLVLSRLGLRSIGPDDDLAHELGIPLTLALALMKDYRGDIALDLPISGRLDAPEFSFGGVVRQALLKAVQGALLSPLNALGRVLLRDGRVEGFTLDPIPFTAGETELNSAGRARVAQVGRLLQVHEYLMVRVRGQVAADDAAVVEDRDLLAAIGSDPGAASLRAYLAARLVGGPPPALAREDRARLDALRNEHPWSGPALRAIAVARGTTVAATIVSEYGIDRGRVVVDAPAVPRAGNLDDAPAVDVQLQEP